MGLHIPNNDLTIIQNTIGKIEDDSDIRCIYMWELHQMLKTARQEACDQYNQIINNMVISHGS